MEAYGAWNLLCRTLAANPHRSSFRLGDRRQPVEICVRDLTATNEGEWTRNGSTEELVTLSSYLSHCGNGDPTGWALDEVGSCAEPPAPNNVGLGVAETKRAIRLG